VCARSDDAALARLLRDPLIRLVMDSDSVTEQAMIALMQQLRRSLAAREAEAIDLGQCSAMVQC
jgi:hypothetical protein